MQVSPVGFPQLPSTPTATPALFQERAMRREEEAVPLCLGFYCCKLLLSRPHPSTSAKFVIPDINLGAKNKQGGLEERALTTVEAKRLPSGGTSPGLAGKAATSCLQPAARVPHKSPLTLGAATLEVCAVTSASPGCREV